jgi:hypothetical protein
LSDTFCTSNEPATHGAHDDDPAAAYAFSPHTMHVALDVAPVTLLIVFGGHSEHSVDPRIAEYDPAGHM